MLYTDACGIGVEELRGMEQRQSKSTPFQKCTLKLSKRWSKLIYNFTQHNVCSSRVVYSRRLCVTHPGYHKVENNSGMVCAIDTFLRANFQSNIRPQCRLFEKKRNGCVFLWRVGGEWVGSSMLVLRHHPLDGFMNV